MFDVKVVTLDVFLKFFYDYYYDDFVKIQRSLDYINFDRENLLGTSNLIQNVKIRHLVLS